MKYSLPIMGCLCLLCRVRAGKGMRGGHQQCGPLLSVSPHSLPQSFPPWRDWWKQTLRSRPGRGRGHQMDASSVPDATTSGW